MPIASALLIAFVCLIPSSALAQFNTVDAVLRAAVRDGRVAGVVGVAVTSDGIVYEGAFGKQEVANDVDMTIDSLFAIYSMTKPITSVALMQLVEQKQVSLDDPAAEYAERLRDVKVLTGFDADGEGVSLRDPSGPVTVRHLLTHTSGFGYEMWNADLHQLVSEGALVSLLSRTPGYFGAPLVFDPGERWEYGISTDWVGRLVEEVSGQTLDAYFREHIFEPLGMSDTFYNVPVDRLARRATVHARQADGSLEEEPLSSPPEVTLFGGGAGLTSSARDYGRFVRMLLRGGVLDGTRVIRRPTIDLMAENHIGDLEAGAMKTAAPGLTPGFDFFPDSVDKFGLGFLINTDPVPGGRAAGSLAWAGAANTYFWVDREKRVAGVLLAQVRPFYDAGVVDLLEQFERALYAALGKG